MPAPGTTGGDSKVPAGGIDCDIHPAVPSIKAGLAAALGEGGYQP